MAKQAFCSLALLLLLLLQHGTSSHGDFVRTSRMHFVVNGRPFYSNGFNAYWLMTMASIPTERDKVSSVFQQASSHGLNVARTWAFSDGGNSSSLATLQISPGNYNEDTFKGFDFVISEARKYGVYMILSLVNNFNDFGGRKQYVQWAKDQGQQVTDEDDFYRNDLIKGWYKNNIKAMLTRKNTVTGVAYKDDPTIFAWELINEPHCPSDPSGTTLQNWISEMAAYVKSIDSNHMLEVGLEGFYAPDRQQFNPNNAKFGANFISNNQIPQIDFTTIHMYPDIWLDGSSDEAQLSFVKSWIASHVNFASTFIGKPLMVGEFGKNTKIALPEQRDKLYSVVYDHIYYSARAGGPGAGALFWQLLVEGMESWGDGYDIIFSRNVFTANIISQQASKISRLS